MGSSTQLRRKRQKSVVGSAVMHENYGGGLRFFFEKLFGPIEYPKDKAKALRALADDGGVLVYVTRSPSVLLALYLNHAVSRAGLPLARFVGGINMMLWQPVGRVWRLMRDRKARKTLAKELGSDLTVHEAMLARKALEHKASFIVVAARGKENKASRAKDDFIHTLLRVQRALKRPIYVVPHALADRMFKSQTGGRKSTGAERLRSFAMLLTPGKSASVRIADPINLKELIDAHPEDDDARLTRRLRLDIHRRIDDEERVICGPPQLPSEVVIRHVLRDPNLRETIEHEAQEQSTSVATLEKQARTHVRDIAARYRARMVRIFDVFLHWVFNRIYDGLVVDHQGLELVVDAARRGPLVFTPSHRSHIDYLVLSYILWRQGLTPPHVAAGANLSFFPVGWFFRRGGAFFLRRSFGEDAVYRAVFRAYVYELLRHGTSIEFFPEGTRTRTGKLLMPRFGMFSMVVDAWRQKAQDDIQIVPVSLDYERVIEGSAYEKELAGEEKHKENVSGLIRSAKVLRSRYGRVHVQFGNPISIKEYAERHGLEQSYDRSEREAWRAHVERLGFVTMYEIAQVCSVTPVSVVSTAVLAHHSRGVAQEELLHRCGLLIDFLDVAGARLSSTLLSPVLRREALLQSVESLVTMGDLEADRAGRRDSEPIYHVPEEKRVSLDFYKNALMNHFASVSIIARALLRQDKNPAPYESVRRDALFLSRLFKREFFFRADSTFDTYFDDGLAVLAVRGYLNVLEDDVEIRDQPMLDLLSGLTDSFIEAYWVATETCHDLQEFPLWERELKTRALERSRRAFLVGDIRRPEAAGRTIIDGAIGWLVEQGVLQRETGAKRVNLSLSEQYSGDALGELSTKIRRLI